MSSQKQTDSRLSGRLKHPSSNKMAQIRLHIKTEKTSKYTEMHLEARPKQRSSADRINHDANSHQIGRLEHSLKSIREQTASSVWQKTNELAWKMSRTNDAVIKRAPLPEIHEMRGVEWLEGGAGKRAAASKSMKIPFKELVPVKEVSKEDRIENLRRIRDEFRELVNTSNHVSVRNSETVFRAYVEKGNNGILVKELLKKRWWWHLEEKEPNKADLYWSEWFNRACTQDMPEAPAAPPKEQDYAQKAHTGEPREQSIRMILDEQTFTRIKPRISIREEHYLRSHKPVCVRETTQEVKEISARGTIHNHIDGCLQLHSKKLLFKNFYAFLKRKEWDPFQFIPVTYYLDSADSPVLQEIMAHYDAIAGAEGEDQNLWIVKPGENSNRGFGISVHRDRQELLQQLQKRLQQGRRSVIVQKYLQKCFLVYNRKFDIRCYILITTVNGRLKGYWYNDGYIRTSSEEYDLTDVSNRMIHLTNDAVQKHNTSYGKYEDFNKVLLTSTQMSFPNFRKYLQKVGLKQEAFDRTYEQMKLIAYYLIASVAAKIRRKQYTFELFGLDFMLDHQLNPLLIEANSNPCLETSGVILGKLIPELVDNVLMTAVDPLFPPPNKSKAKEYISKDYFRSNKFELIFTDSPNQE